MARIRAKDTKPELFIRSELHKRGYRFKVHSKLVMGIPDLYFSKKQVAVFIHGCYWHRHPGCKFAYTPKSNVEFWIKKFDSNIKRDQAVLKILHEKDIRVLIIWECTVKNMISNSQICVNKLSAVEDFINNNKEKYCEV